MNTVFTPGPWEVVYPTRSSERLRVRTVSERQEIATIAKVHGGFEGEPTYNFNARLIAAAPEMLHVTCAAIDSLALIVNELHNLQLNGGDVHNATPGDFRALAREITRIFEPVRAAIARAKGRS